MNIFEIVTSISDILDDLGDCIRNEYKEHIIDLAENKEGKIAFEELRNQIYDNEVSISQAIYSKIAILGSSLEFSPTEWEYLKELVK